MSGEPFHRCTHTAMAPNGDIYVSDGYGNARVHKYAPDGRLLLSWGGPGTDPGEFNIAHNITCDADGWVYVADRENHRVQVFDGNGKYETQWNNLHRPCGLFMPGGKCPICYIGELGPVAAGQPRRPEPRPARDDRRQHRQTPRRGSAACGRDWASISSWHRTACVSTAEVTFTWARCRGRSGRNGFRRTRCRTICDRCESSAK